MTEQELNQMIDELESEFHNKKRELWKKYALLNNTYKKGDIIRDRSSTVIIIDRIRTYKGYGAPECVYDGISLKKDGKPFKDRRRGSIYQSNIVT